MQIYEGRLALTKTTRTTVVYGNADLHAQYIPKTMIQKVGKAFPPELVFTIELPDSSDGKKVK